MISPETDDHVIGHHSTTRVAIESESLGDIVEPGSRETKESWEKGIEHFREAIRLDPGYALAYAGIADSYNMMGYWGSVPPREAFPKAKAAAARSLESDPTLAEAHCALAYARFEYDWDLANIENEYLRAIDLNPSYASAHQWYAEYLMINQRPAEAEVELRKARELDPLSQPIKLIGITKFQNAVSEFRIA